MDIQEIVKKLPKDIDWDHVKEHMKDRRVQLGVIAGVSATYFVYKQLTKKRYKLPPGPMALPLVGNLHSLGFSGLHKTFTELSKIYGPVFTIYMGPMRVIVLNDVDIVKEAFVTKGPDFAGRMKSPTMDLFTDNGKSLSTVPYGPVWKVQRKIAHAALRKYASGNNLQNLVECSFEKTAKEIEKSDDPIDPTYHLLLFTLNVIASMCFGKQFDLEDEFIKKFREADVAFKEPNISSQIMLMDTFPIFAKDIFGLKAMKLMKEFFGFYMDFIGTSFDEHMQTYDPANMRDLMDQMIYHWKEAESEKDDQTALSQLTKNHFIFTLIDIFSGGTDTTRMTLSFFILYLAKFPEIQKRVHDEVESVFGSNKPTTKSKEQLHYTYAVLYELMRIAPLAAIGFPHVTMCDTTLGKYDIPKGTTVFTNVYGIHHDPTAYKDPEIFNPDRWLDKDGKMNTQAGPWIPFSIGTRNCVGESLAKIEIVMVMAMFVQRYKFEAPPGVELSVEPKEIMSSLDVEPYEVLFTPRH